MRLNLCVHNKGGKRKATQRPVSLIVNGKKNSIKTTFIKIEVNVFGVVKSFSTTATKMIRLC